MIIYQTVFNTLTWKKPKCYDTKCFNIQYILRHKVEQSGCFQYNTSIHFYINLYLYLFYNFTEFVTITPIISTSMLTTTLCPRQSDTATVLYSPLCGAF